MLGKKYASRLFFCFCLSLGLLLPLQLSARAAEVLTLPRAETSGGLALMEALAQRKSSRTFSDAALSAQDLSNILWAAWGVSRADGRRTVPTSQNKQNVQLFAVLESGVWEYDGAKQTLTQVLKEDERSKFGGAPLTLVYAAEDNYYASGMHVGSMYQNVGLYCASAGLGNVVKRTGVDVLEGRLPLAKDYRIYIVQSVGHPG